MIVETRLTGVCLVHLRFAITANGYLTSSITFFSLFFLDGYFHHSRSLKSYFFLSHELYTHIHLILPHGPYSHDPERRDPFIGPVSPGALNLSTTQWMADLGANDPRTGSARNNHTSPGLSRIAQGSNSSATSNLVATLVPVLILFGVCLIIFVIARRKFLRVYAPRSILKSLEPQYVCPLFHLRRLYRATTALLMNAR